MSTVNGIQLVRLYLFDVYIRGDIHERESH